MASDPRDTPAMRQYYRFKRQHPDCALFFRIGDFYEMFDEDAVRVSKALGLTMTKRTEGVPMCGVPYHQLETYLRKAIGAGFRVAVCEQVQDAAAVKPGAIIERGVTRVLTPGTLVDELLLEEGATSLLASVCFLESGDESSVACAVADLSTGQFEVFASTAANLPDELGRRSVTELLYVETSDGRPPARVQNALDALSISGTPVPSWHFRPTESGEALAKHFEVATLEGFGFEAADPLLRPAGALIRYLETTQLPESSGKTNRSLKHLRPPRKVVTKGCCVLDATTLRALEVFRTIRPGSNSNGGLTEHDGSLLGVFLSGRSFAGCRTSMGKRLLREWLCRPLSEIGTIDARQRRVGQLAEDQLMAQALGKALEEVQDVARIAGRLSLGRVTPRDLVGLGRSLAQVEPLGTAVQSAAAFTEYARVISQLKTELGPIAIRIATLCVESPPPHMRDGGLIRDGVDHELDEARGLQRDGGDWMSAYQARLIAEHDLPSLKVGYNSVFGYYIELPTAQSKRAPIEFSRKQTLKNAERYITPELKEFEGRVLSAQSRALAREVTLFEDLCVSASKLIPAIGAFADATAELDVLLCFADKAQRRGWVRPEIVDKPVLLIKQGRHPGLDEKLEGSFVPNDVELGAALGSPDTNAAHLALITGPNMAGKSTFIRTAALLTLLAHTGSFVPAEAMTVGLTDRIFTRIGADDALHAGQSTFMVEMTETARILNHATSRSLVVLDEIGRGTSTLDGLSLAWAIAETLAGETTSVTPRTLFATHYHELTDLEEQLEGRVKNLNVLVREWGDQIVFLHRIVPGRADQSYGIHVAKLAGLPKTTIERARQVLDSVAVQHHMTGGQPAKADAANGHLAKGKRKEQAQMSLFTEFVPHPAVDRLRELKLDGVTPLQAFDALRVLHELTHADGQTAAKS